ncbi:MAG TPA: NTP transferase domain-containing protein [Candidatus Eremiobacteraceae bacterium]|nr:NTP transferase domain-containing protein [Candidatus Eremiobacteraceae bacterium]
MIDAIITAGGRLPSDVADRYGTDIKGCVRIGDESLLARTVSALRGVAAVERITLVAPEKARSEAAVDEFIVEKTTGEENLLAALSAARGERTIFCASDMPFISSYVLCDLLERAPEPAVVVYPIFTRDEFERAYPGGRSSFAHLADGAWTGASALVVRAAPLLQHRGAITRAFSARKSLPALAGLFGSKLMIAYLRRMLRVSDVEARAAGLLGGPVVAMRGADPALAFDCDDESDFVYAETLLARTTPWSET